MYICKDCGAKVALSKVCSHYKNKHFCDCRCNRELLEKHPELFVTKGSGSTKKTETRILTARQKNGYEQRLRRIISIIEQKCDKQTYRGGKLFICYSCQEAKSSGKLLIDENGTRFHLCNEYYKYASSRLKDEKQGGTIVEILTPFGGQPWYHRWKGHP